jgi:uncharacterized LabA/DUF88 family protein
MRIYVYVDGFNLYYRAIKGTRYKWLDLNHLARRLMPGADNSIDRIRYFTARVKARSGNPEGPRRQQIYLSALGTLPNVEIHYGSFLAKSKRRPLKDEPTRFVEVLDTEEKGSDVNLAVHLLHDAWHDRYDAALVLSQDTDLCEPMRLVRDELKKEVGLVVLDGREPHSNLKRVSSFVKHIIPAYLSTSQFPPAIARLGQPPIQKPATW